MQIKESIKKIIGYKRLHRFYYAKKISVLNNTNKFSTYFRVKNYDTYTKLVNSIELKKTDSKDFYYNIDINRTYYSEGKQIGNLMLDYNMILDKSLNDYKDEISKIKDKEFYNQEEDLLNGLILLANKEIGFIDNDDIKDSIKGIIDRKANSFKDAIQRILFINQMLWQTGIFLNGIGRLDLILDKYYKEDIKNNKLTKEEAKEYLRDFLIILHKDYYFKSNTIAGDTGQIIILGGLNPDGTYFYNDLTYIIIELMEELKEPDPKVLLRVSEKTPRDILDLSLRCIQTGIGCPLFANDDVIIEKLINFGFDKKDAYNYGTAACWEPYIPGKSFDQNNIQTINYMIPFNNMLSESKFDSIDSLIKTYYEYLNKYLDNFVNEVDNMVFAKNPLLSLFNMNCISSEKDIACGGAVYNNYGFTSVGLANLVNSIYSVEHFVFDTKEYSYDDFIKVVHNNYADNDLLVRKIKNLDNKYGVDDKKIIELCNKIISETTKFFNGKTTKLGGKYKFGLSAPSYIDDSVDVLASPDGRKNGEPFSVHISNDKSNGYTELINFASKLDYNENRFNGNVIDFFVTPNFINDNFDKFLDFLILSIKNGFFEMQMNVVSSKTLIEAKKDPSKFPNLIVRVWGFSAYFKDLPEEYKDYIIERALKNEGNS